MVFSTYLKETEFGRAKILPCLCEVTRPTDLLNEARCLWAAEDANAPPNALESGFGCVVLLRNPNGNADDALINKWAGQNHFRNVAGTIEGGRLISDQGLLQISWPRLDDGEPVSLDLLLATANEPTLKGEPPVYPSAQTIALAWKKALKERPADMPDDYFWNNRKSGITTFQDEEIERVLNDHSGCLSQLRSILAN
jgi:hypothetical protein